MLAVLNQLLPLEKSIDLLHQATLDFPYQLKFVGNDNLSEDDQILSVEVVVKDLIKSDVPFEVSGKIELDRLEPIHIRAIFSIKLKDQIILGEGDLKAMVMDYNWENRKWSEPYIASL